MAPQVSSSSSDQHQSHPRLRRLASKPLKLAASTLKSGAGVLSRNPSLGPSTNASSTNLDGSSEDADRHKLHIHRSDSRHQRLPASLAASLTPAQIATAAKGPRKPREGEEPAAWLRVRVVSAQGLVAKDRGGTSDPFLNLLMPPATRHTTPVVKKTLDPVFPAETSTFDFPIYISLAGVIGGRGLEGVLWDKDLVRKEYMGEIAIPVEKWFVDGEAHLWHENLPLLTQRLLSTRRKHAVSGTAAFQIGFVQAQGETDPHEALRKARLVYNALLEQSRVGRGSLGVLGVPAHKGIGTVKMRSGLQDQPALLPPPKDKSTFSLLHSATAAVAGTLAGGHKMVPVPGNSGAEVRNDDSEDEDDDLPADDGMSSSSSDDYEDAIDEDDLTTGASSVVETLVEGGYDQMVGLTGPKSSGMGKEPSDDRVPNSAGLLAPSQTPKLGLKTPNRQSSLPDYFNQPVRGEAITPGSAMATPGVTTPGGTKTRRPLFKRNKSRAGSSTQVHQAEKKQSKRGFNFNASQSHDMLGIVILEIKSAADLPKLKNALRVSFDMDPFVVISFGKKVFRTRVIRHSLNPTWDEKLLFHVRRHESSFTMQFAVLDWDKVSGNDMVGTCTLPLSELVADAPKPNPETGLYDKEVDGKHEMKEFTLSLSTNKEMPWEAKHSPKLTIRAKYEPYDALRQRFWRQYIMQYDADDTGAMSYTELTTMLDSLGSTLTSRTLEGYFSSCGKSADKDELTVEEVIKCFENEVTKSQSEKEKVSNEDTIISGGATPAISAQPAHDGLNMVGPESNKSAAVDPDELADHIRNVRPREYDQGRNDDPAGNMIPIQANGRRESNGVPAVKVERTASFDGSTVAVNNPRRESGAWTPGSETSEVDVDDFDSSSPSPTDDRERIINIKTCPLCHRPRLGKKTEQDIVTHLAVCASADWSRVDRIVTANYVTPSQAQRKFLSKIVNKVAIGSYALGANSANVIVQDRRTGQLQEEKMAVYVRVGIRVLYKGAKGSMHGARARKLLKSMSIKQGLKFDNPSSALDIPAFIAFHNLDTSEILDPLESFKTFNEFFYRKLKPDARPTDEPNDSYRLVSCADCRMMAFETVNEATQIWIKGREFTVGRLLGPNYKDLAENYEGGALAIFRLAPQDYHRFHSPVKGKVGKMTLIDGEYYTVNPQAIRTTLDVYGENVRKVVPIHSEEFGMVMTVWVGAMMVGSILTSVEEGQEIDRADELGYFAFGGSTIVCLFEKGVLKWDEDLLQNGRASIETLVRMGMGIGRSTRKPQA